MDKTVFEHTIRSNMRRIRESTPWNGGKPLSLRRMAENLGTNSVNLSRFETGRKSKFNADMVRKYSETLGVPLDLFYQASEVDLLDISRRRYEEVASELAKTQKKLRSLVGRGKPDIRVARAAVPVSSAYHDAPKDFGKLVRSLRKNRGITLIKFGTLCGIPWRTIQDFERGRHTPSINRVDQMLGSLGFSLALKPHTVPNYTDLYRINVSTMEHQWNAAKPLPTGELADDFD